MSDGFAVEYGPAELEVADVGLTPQLSYSIIRTASSFLCVIAAGLLDKIS
jgi:hypothetical protein